MITVGCDACGKIHHVKDDYGGKKAKCGCGAFVLVPKAESNTTHGRVNALPVSTEAAPPRVETVAVSNQQSRRLTTGYLAVVAAAVLILLVGAGIAYVALRPRAKTEVTFGDASDLYSHPELLRDRTKSAADMTMKGVRLGDVRAKAAALVATGADDGGNVIGTEGNFNYVIRDGRVVSFVIADNDWLTRADVMTYDDARKVMGEPTIVHHGATWHTMAEMAAERHTAPPADNDDVMKAFHYRDRHIILDAALSHVLRLTADTPGIEDLRDYISDVEPYAEALRSLNTRAGVGLNLAEYRQAVQDLALKRAKIANYPREWDAAKSFAKFADQAYEGDLSALRGWTGMFSKSQFEDAITGNTLAIDAFDRMKSTH